MDLWDAIKEVILQHHIFKADIKVHKIENRFFTFDHMRRHLWKGVSYVDRIKLFVMPFYAILKSKLNFILRISL